VKVEAPTRPQADADGIRALVLTPTSGPKASMSTFSSGGSGGGPPADVNPMLLVTGGGWGGSFETSPGHYVDPQFVPVGALVTIQTTSLPPGYDLQSATWAGGTDFKSYFSQDGGNHPNVPQSVVTGVPTNQFTYTFIADTNPRNYTITANVVYTNGAHGTSVMNFTTQKPSASLAVFDRGSTKIYVPPNPLAGLGASVQYDNWGPPNPGFPANAGMRIEATTSALETGDSFMFLQTVQASRTAVINLHLGMGNQNIKWTDGIGGTALDTFNKSNTVAYQTDSTSAFPTVFQWTMNPGDTPKKNKLSDTPDAFSTNAGEIVSLDVGAVPQGENPPVVVPETFETYLMYRPQGGVWVSIAELDWNWSGGMLRNAAGNLIEDPANPVSSPAPPLERRP